MTEFETAVNKVMGMVPVNSDTREIVEIALQQGFNDGFLSCIECTESIMVGTGDESVDSIFEVNLDTIVSTLKAAHSKMEITK